MADPICACGCGREVEGRGKSVGGKRYRTLHAPKPKPRSVAPTTFSPGDPVTWFPSGGSARTRRSAAIDAEVVRIGESRVTIITPDGESHAVPAESLQRRAS